MYIILSFQCLFAFDTVHFCAAIYSRLSAAFPWFLFPQARLVRFPCDEHPFGFRGHNNLCFRKPFQHTRDGSGMVLLGIMRDDKVDFAHTVQLRHRFIGHGRIDRVQQSGLLAAFNQISIVRRAIWKRDEGIKKTPVPINGS